MKKLVLMLILMFVGLPSLCRAEDSDTVWTRYTHDISRLEFSNDDSKILTVGSGGIIIFDTQTGTQQHSLPGYWDAEYSQDCLFIFAVRHSHDSVNHVFPVVDIYNSISYELIKSFVLPNLPVDLNDGSKITVSDDNQTIAVSNIGGLFILDYPISPIFS